jgi:hypothetical protein
MGVPVPGHLLPELVKRITGTPDAGSVSLADFVAFCAAEHEEEGDAVDNAGAAGFQANTAPAATSIAPAAPLPSPEEAAATAAAWTLARTLHKRLREGVDNYEQPDHHAYFRAMDRDGDGAVRPADFVRECELWGVPATEGEVAAMMTVVWPGAAAGGRGSQAPSVDAVAFLRFFEGALP